MKLIHRFITYLITVFNYPLDSITKVDTVTNTVDVINTVEVKYAVLPYELYKQLERSVSSTLVSNTTTELEAGFKLGIQTVLEKVRNGYAIEKS